MRSLVVAVVEVSAGVVVAADLAQDHGFDALEVVEAVESGIAKGVAQGLFGIVTKQPTEVAKASDAASPGCAATELGDPSGMLGELGVQLALLGNELLVTTTNALEALGLG